MACGKLPLLWITFAIISSNKDLRLRRRQGGLKRHRIVLQVVIGRAPLCLVDGTNDAALGPGVGDRQFVLLSDHVGLI
jgi:hypothetical protein